MSNESTPPGAPEIPHTDKQLAEMAMKTIKSALTGDSVAAIIPPHGGKGTGGRGA